MNKSGLADSPFFKPPAIQSVPATPPLTEPPIQNEEVAASALPKKKKVKKQSNHDTTTPSNHDTTVSRYHDTTTPSIYGVDIETVRKAVKEYGKDAATHRFTEAEKREISDLIYTYKSRGIKSNENEITRIAVNFVIKDYQENGENSVLNKILQALNE